LFKYSRDEDKQKQESLAMNTTTNPQPELVVAESDMLSRPEEGGFAIDPANPQEIDDAIFVEKSRISNLARIMVHVADGGLLYGTPYVNMAREQGWSRYYDDREAELMLPKHIALDTLSLTASHHDLGAPSITTAFTFDGEAREISEVSIYKSRVNCKALSYEQFARDLKLGNGELKRITKKAGQLNNPSGRRMNYEGTKAGEHVVSEFMLATNRLIAEHMQLQGLPWLFRNHHIKHFDGPQADTIHQIYPHADLFAEHSMAWYGRIATRHSGLDVPVYCHFTSPLRRFPDLVNHLTLHAAQEGLDPPYTADEIDKIAIEMAQKTSREVLAKQIT
jgi:ribonuclease R